MYKYLLVAAAAALTALTVACVDDTEVTGGYDDENYLSSEDASFGDSRVDAGQPIDATDASSVTADAAPDAASSDAGAAPDASADAR